MEQQRVLAERYRLNNLIGAGGAAEVYRAEDLRLGRTVAVKILRPQFVADAEQLGRFENEARSAAALSHPNVIDVYDFGKAGDTAFIVMQYIDGMTLKEYINEQGRLLPVEAGRIALAVCRGLEAAHNRVLIHRDVKPQNIMIDKRGQVRITDFGIAKALGSASFTQTGMTYGTAAYLLPEQATGAPVGPASDVYSLGLVLYEMLSGSPAVVGETLPETVYKQVYDQPTPLQSIVPGLAPQLVQIVERAIAKDPATRYADAGAMAAALNKFLSVTPPPRYAIGVPNNEISPVYGPPALPGAQRPPAVAAQAPINVQPTAMNWTSIAARPNALLIPLLVIALLVIALLLFLGGRFIGASRSGGATPTPLIGAIATDTSAPAATDIAIIGGDPPTATSTTEQIPVPPTDTAAPIIVVTDTAEPPAPTDTTEPLAPTDTPAPPTPTDTLAPTDTPVPTDTPEPPAPTDTPEPPTPTDTPEPPAPTDTPEPPAPTKTPKPPTAPTATATSGSRGHPVFPTPTVPTAVDRVVTLEDVAFDGGYRYQPPSIYPPGANDGHTAVWVYGQGSGFDTMTAAFNIAGLPDGQAELLISGIDSEGAQKTRIRISFNGVPVYEGADPLPDYPNWGSRTLSFDARYLQQGQNYITFTNLSNGQIGGAPFMMIDYVQIGWQAEQ